MPHSFGYRARTRSMFSKDAKKHGVIALNRFQTTYRIGDIVDIKGDGGSHKGMPHKFYHGKTGVVWNVTRRAIGVVVNKRVGGRIMPKRIHVRIEHAFKSKCRQEFLDRVKRNDALKKEAAAKKVRVFLKRQPAQPQVARFIAPSVPVTSLTPKPFVWLA
jgi:large subunit ribosomal protein L21e